MAEKNTPEYHRGIIVEYEPQLQEFSVEQALMASVQRCDYFAQDETDEFKIRREDGTEQGIFKVWAAPIIPVLETKNMDVQEALETWSAECAKKPLSLFESLDKWRSYTALMDRRLQQTYASRELPNDPAMAVSELYNRLATAFAYSAPFYNLEALVADSRDYQDRQDNPIDFDQESASGGKLDAVAMMLPAAFHNYVRADRLEWNGLNWDSIDQDVKTLRQSFMGDAESLAGKQYVLLSKIANQANVELSTVLFAANVLQFIPADVGGKREDMPQDQAMSALAHLFEQPVGDITTATVAKDINALIRFLNWSPAIKSDDNFNGRGMAYDAVCATAAQLVDMIKSSPDAILTSDFAPVFIEQLAPQLDGLDATSAKGRFMLQLLQEGNIKPEINGMIAASAEPFAADIAASLASIAKNEKLADIASLSSTYLVGGKATGLRKAIELFGAEKVVGGHVVTSEAVTAWLNSIGDVRELIDHFTCTQTVDEKITVGQRIIETIYQAPPDVDLIARIQAVAAGMDRIVLRSSAYDEDVDLIGPAPGVYESAINIDPADVHAINAGLKESIASFFSDKAISFRELKGLQHHPVFSVLVQEFMSGAGGSFFVQDGSVMLNIAPSPHQVNGRDALSLVEDLSFSKDARAANSSMLLSDEHVNEILQIAQQAEGIFGPTDVEFVIDPATQGLKLLQLRSLERPIAANDRHEEIGAVTVISINSLDEFPALDELGLVDLHITDPEIDLEKFQGAFFRWIIAHREKVHAITLQEAIPKTCHFANIMESLGIRIQSKHN